MERRVTFINPTFIICKKEQYTLKNQSLWVNGCSDTISFEETLEGRGEFIFYGPPFE